MKPARTPRENSGMVLCDRDARGLLLPMDPLQRFVAKCRFEPATGCVIWTGAQTQGRGNTAVYGGFWFEGRRWFAHRWSGVHIHGLNLDGAQAGHNCPHGPNTLCVEHVVAQTQADNLAEQRERLGPPGTSQDARDRQYWLFVALGIERQPDQAAASPDDIPFYSPPEWFARHQPAVATSDCPF